MLNTLKSKYPQTLDFFMFISLFPKGILGRNISRILGTNDWKKAKTVLMRTSILTQTIEAEGDGKYSLLPVMGFVALQMLKV
jgi:hypothetical protein